MSIALAIDYGTKRCGIAVTDPLQIIASGLTTIHTHDLLNFLSEYIRDNDVSIIVIGEPRKIDNTPGDLEPQIRGLIKKIQKQFPHIEIVRIDERFTTHLAQQSLIQGGVPKMKRRNKALHDKISATIILQSWLYYKK